MTRGRVALGLTLAAAACTQRAAAPESLVRSSGGSAPVSTAPAPTAAVTSSASPSADLPAPGPSTAREMSVSGALPADIVQRIVRQANPQFRACHAHSTSLSARGTVVARFTIIADGTVESVSDDGSDFPEPPVVACVLHVFEGLAFPQPGDGVVTVVYPIALPPPRAH